MKMGIQKGGIMYFCTKEAMEGTHLLRLGVWGAPKLPQQVRAEPGPQTFFVHFDLKMRSLAVMF